MSVVPRRFRGAAYCLRNRPPSQARDRDAPQRGGRAAGPWIQGPRASPVYYRAPMSTLLVSRLRKTYAATVAVDDVTFEVRPREVFGLLGPNGAGKTTLIRMLIDIIAPDSGEILLDGRPLGRAERDRIGYLPEERGLYRKEKVIDILVYFGMLKGLDRGAARARTLEWLERIGMPEVANRRADSLSKGMQQKVQIAGSLLHDPHIVVMDEPFSGLDPLNTVLVKDLLRERRERGGLVILSTHQMPMVEELCDRVAMIDHGRLVLYGVLEEIRRRHGESIVLVGADPHLEDLPVVARHEPQGVLHRVILRDGARPRDLMALLLEKRIAIDHFEALRMPVEDIFVRTVRSRSATPAPPVVAGAERRALGGGRPPRGGRGGARGAPHGPRGPC